MVLHLRGSNLLEGIYLSIGLLLGQQCLSGINLFVEGVFRPFEVVNMTTIVVPSLEEPEGEVCSIHDTIEVEKPRMTLVLIL